MRLAIMSSLVLVPVLAHGQTIKPAQSKPATPSVQLQAEVNQPAGLKAVLNAAAAADAASTMNLASPVTVREFVSTQLTEDFTQEALRRAGRVEYGFAGSTPSEIYAPRIIRSADLQLSVEDMAATPDVSQVVVNGTVDEYGFLRNLSVTHSAGTAVDKKALEAVNDFRYKPAMVNNQPVQAAVSITIKIEKQ
ncbi:MAG TPA: energy transducer TonB [Acidobacteriaceae bacterium]|nr:energy transducer TonB [Acidobacteriaceae bacterium]